MVAEICRKLDGIPLAIELAAGRAAVFRRCEYGGKTGFAARSPEVRPANRESAASNADRNAGLEPTTIFWRPTGPVARVAIFAGHFTLEAALAVAAEAGMDRSEIAEALGISPINLSSGFRPARGGHFTSCSIRHAPTHWRSWHHREQDSIAERHASFAIQMLESNPVNLFDLESTEAAADACETILEISVRA